MDLITAQNFPTILMWALVVLVCIPLVVSGACLVKRAFVPTSLRHVVLPAPSTMDVAAPNPPLQAEDVAGKKANRRTQSEVNLDAFEEHTRTGIGAIDAAYGDMLAILDGD